MSRATSWADGTRTSKAGIQLSEPSRLETAYKRWVETILIWMMEFVVAPIFIPIEFVFWWLTRDWLGIDWRWFLVLVLLAWVIYAPLYIIVRSAFGKPDPEVGYRNIQWIPPEVIARAASSGLAFSFVAHDRLAALGVGLGAGLIVAVGTVLFQKPWAPSPQPISKPDDQDTDE